jgi:hypothetical protein
VGRDGARQRVCAEKRGTGTMSDWRERQRAESRSVFSANLGRAAAIPSVYDRIERTLTLLLQNRHSSHMPQEECLTAIWGERGDRSFFGALSANPIFVLQFTKTLAVLAAAYIDYDTILKEVSSVLADAFIPNKVSFHGSASDLEAAGAGNRQAVQTLQVDVRPVLTWIMAGPRMRHLVPEIMAGWLPETGRAKKVPTDAYAAKVAQGSVVPTPAQREAHQRSVVAVLRQALAERRGLGISEEDAIGIVKAAGIVAPRIRVREALRVIDPDGRKRGPKPLPNSPSNSAANSPANLPVKKGKAGSQ